MKKITLYLLMILPINIYCQYSDDFDQTTTDSIIVEELIRFVETTMLHTEGNLQYIDDTLRFYNGSKWILIMDFNEFIDSLSQLRTDLMRKDAFQDSINANKLIDSTTIDNLTRAIVNDTSDILRAEWLTDDADSNYFNLTGDSLSAKTASKLGIDSVYTNLTKSNNIRAVINYDNIPSIYQSSTINNYNIPFASAISNTDVQLTTGGAIYTLSGSTSATGQVLYGASSTASINSDNTANWAKSTHPLVQAIAGELTTQSGSSGAIAEGAVYYGTASSSTGNAYYENAYIADFGFQVTNSNIPKAIGIRIEDLQAGQSGATGIFLNDEGGDLAPDGHFAIYDSTGYNSRFSGNLDLMTGKSFTINKNSVLSSTALGSGVINSSLTSVGTIGTGVWNGTAIGDSYISSAANWNTAYSHSQLTSGNPHSVTLSDLSVTSSAAELNYLDGYVPTTNQIAYGNGTRLASSSNLTWSGSILYVNGNAGIGNSSPSFSIINKNGLNLKAEGDYFTGVRIERTGGTLKTDNAWEWFIGSAGGMAFRDVSVLAQPFTIQIGAANYSFYIDSTNFIGIGTNTPSQELDVNGDFRVRGDTIIFGSTDPDTITHSGNKTTGTDTLQRPAFEVGLNSVMLTETNGDLIISANEVELDTIKSSGSYVNVQDNIKLSGLLNIDNGTINYDVLGFMDSNDTLDVGNGSINALRVKTDLVVDGAIKYETPNTKYYSINPGDFVSINPYADLVTYDNAYVQADEDAVLFYCPVNLPHGATITSISIKSNVSDESYYLNRNDFAAASTQMATANFNTADVTISDATIDNANYSYSISTTSIDNTDRIYGGVIIYTLSGL